MSWTVPSNTFPYGYNKDGAGVAGMGTMLTIAQLEKKKTVYNLHPEFWRRYKALMQFALSEKVHLGVGTGWRVQPNPPPPGFAKPGNSNHEGFPANGVAGGAVAIDTVCQPGWAFMEKHLKAYGLRSFVQPSTTGYKGTDEPWHIQPAEIPASRSYRQEPWKLAEFKLPEDIPEPPEPPPVKPVVEEEDMLFICKVGTAFYVGDGVRANAVPSSDVDTLKANVEGVNTARWHHPARSGLPVLTKMSDVPAINAGQRDLLVGKVG